MVDVKVIENLNQLVTRHLNVKFFKSGEELCFVDALVAVDVEELESFKQRTTFLNQLSCQIS